MISIAKKLREMRISRGLTLEQAAKLAGFRNFQTLAKIENGHRSIKAEELVSFAHAYSFDINLFLLHNHRPSQVNIFWRSDPNPPDDKSAQAKFTMFFERYVHLSELLDLSNTKLALPLQTIAEMNLKHADSLGETYSGLLKLGDRPALSLASILENECNLPIFYLSLPAGASAISLISNGNAAMCINRRDAPWRQRFDIAHELFHIINKKSISDECGESEAGLFEKCANAFAAAILLPRNVLDREIDVRRNKEKIGVASLAAMACDFGVSLSALLWRLVNLGRIRRNLAEAILDSEDIRTRDKELRKQQSSEIPHISHRYVCMVFEAVNQGLMSQMRAAEYLDMPISKLESIFLSAGLILKEEPGIEVTLM